MRDLNRPLRITLTLCFAVFCAALATAQVQQSMKIQATAMGTSTQMGKMYNVEIVINQLSTPNDQKKLIDAFSRGGQDGLVSALERMDSKGRVRFSMGGVGNDIKHIIELPSKNGSRRLRLVTDRNVAFGELYASTRSSDYNVGVIELTLTPDGKGTGTVLPACRLKLDKKKKQLEVETYQNPWKLDNFIIHKD
jgi:hypothetical protein